MADTKSNRIAVSNVVTSVTREHGFKPNPRRLNSSVLVAAYAPSPGASQKQINLTASIYQNRITAGLAQIKVGRRRTSYYLEIQNDLIQRFKSEFGGNVEIKVYDEEMPP